jgi:hypothetical protein
MPLPETRLTWWNSHRNIRAVRGIWTRELKSSVLFLNAWILEDNEITVHGFASSSGLYTRLAFCLNETKERMFFRHYLTLGPGCGNIELLYTWLDVNNRPKLMGLVSHLRGMLTLSSPASRPKGGSWCSLCIAQNAFYFPERSAQFPFFSCLPHAY